jgi:hypothetical protein
MPTPFSPCLMASHTWVEQSEGCYTVQPTVDPLDEDACTDCIASATAQLEVRARHFSHERPGYPSPDGDSPKKFKKKNTTLESHWDNAVDDTAPTSQDIDASSTLDAEMDMLGNETWSGSGEITGQDDTRTTSDPYYLCVQRSFSGMWSVDDDGCVSGSWDWTRVQLDEEHGCGTYPGLDNSNGSYAQNVAPYPTVTGEPPSMFLNGCSSLGDGGINECYGSATEIITVDSYQIVITDDPPHGSNSYSYNRDYTEEVTNAMLISFVEEKLATLPALSSLSWGVSATLYPGSKLRTTGCGIEVGGSTSATVLNAVHDAAVSSLEGWNDAVAADALAVSAAEDALAEFESDYVETHGIWQAAMLAWCEGEGDRPSDTEVLAYFSARRGYQATLAAAIQNKLDSERRKNAATKIKADAQAAKTDCQDGTETLLKRSDPAYYEVTQEAAVVADTCTVMEMQFRYRVDLPYFAGPAGEEWTVAVAAAGFSEVVTIAAGDCYGYTSAQDGTEGVEMWDAEVVLTRNL